MRCAILMLLVTCLVRAAEKPILVWSAEDGVPANISLASCQAAMVRDAGKPALQLTFSGADWGHALFSWNGYHEAGGKAIVPTETTRVALRVKLLEGSTGSRLKFLCAGTKSNDSERRFLQMSSYAELSDKRYVDVVMPLQAMVKTGGLDVLGLPIHTAFFGKHGDVKGGLLVRQIVILPQ